MDLYVVWAWDLVLAEIETWPLILLSVVQETITVQYALLLLEAIVDEMNTEAAGIGVQTAISVVDQGPHMIEVGDIEAGALGQGIRMMNQTCRCLEGNQQKCQTFN